MGGLTSLLLTMILSAILAKMVETEALAQRNIGYGVMILLLISSFLGAAAAQGRVKHQRLLVCILSGCVYFLLLLGITALFFGGQYSGMGVTALLVFGGAGTAALLCTRQGKGSHKRKLRSRKVA